MPYPAGVSLAVITTGSVTDFFGNDTAVTATVTPVLKGTSHIVHETTGAVLIPSPQVFTVGAGEGISFAVPHTDQDGWRDGAGNAYKGWYYKVELKIGRGSGPSWTKTVQPKLGQALIDLDLVAGEQIGVPVSAPVPTVLSIAGLTGAVTQEQLAELGLGGASDGEIAVLVQDPETATGAALAGTYALGFAADTAITYDDAGNVETVTENGITTTYTYDSEGNVATDSRTVNGATTTRTYSYSNGNLISITEVAA